MTSAGAEALPFLASFCVLPASLLFFFAYGRFVEFLPPHSVFYASVVPLVSSSICPRQDLPHQLPGSVCPGSDPVGIFSRVVVGDALCHQAKHSRLGIYPD